MSSIEKEIRERAKIQGVPQGTLEKDFALSYILAGMSQHPVLNKTLVFKGGTALKKCYFGNYRFSEDLDFSTLEAPKQSKLEQALKESLNLTQGLLEAIGPFSIEMSRYTEKHPHPREQEAFKVGVLFPWQRNINCRIKVEISHHEPVIESPIPKPLIHDYTQPLDATIDCYTLNEVVAEKMRALLQSHQKLVQNSWHRPRARDYYDLWQILKTFGDQLDPDKLLILLKQKAEYSEVSFKALDDFFTPELGQEAHEYWQPNLGSFVVDLPPCETVLKELKVSISDYFPSLK